MQRLVTLEQVVSEELLNVHLLNNESEARQKANLSLSVTKVFAESIVIAVQIYPRSLQLVVEVEAM